MFFTETATENFSEAVLIIAVMQSCQVNLWQEPLTSFPKYELLAGIFQGFSLQCCEQLFHRTPACCYSCIFFTLTDLSKSYLFLHLIYNLNMFIYKYPAYFSVDSIFTMAVLLRVTFFDFFSFWKIFTLLLKLGSFGALVIFKNDFVLYFYF